METSTVLILKSKKEHVGYVKSKKGIKKMATVEMEDRNAFVSYGYTPDNALLEFESIFRLKSPKYDDFKRIFEMYTSFEHYTFDGRVIDGFSPEAVICVDLEQKTWKFNLVFRNGVEYMGKKTLYINYLPIFENRPFGESISGDWYENASKNVRNAVRYTGIKELVLNMDILQERLYPLSLFACMMDLGLHSEKDVQNLEISEQDRLNRLGLLKEGEINKCCKITGLSDIGFWNHWIKLGIFTITP